MPDSYHDRRLRGNAFKESQYPVVSGTRCVQVHIPDDPKFLHQLAGLMAMATKQYQYQNWDSAHAAIIAQQWRDAYLETDWSECMDCEKIIDCIENDEDVQNALKAFLDSNYNFGATDYPTNVPLPDSVRGADRASLYNPSCDWDILWAQSTQLVEWMTTLMSDALQIVESKTNNIEVVQSITAMTGLDETNVDAIASYIGNLQEFINENYEASLTDAYKIQLASDIFCLSQMDCEITLDDLYGIFYVRVTDYLGAGVFDILDDIIDYLTGGSIDGTIVVDAAMLLLWGGINLANWIINGKGNGNVEVGTLSLNILLKLAVNDANNDWVFLADCVDTQCWDISIVPYGTILEGEAGSDEVYENFIHATVIADGAKGEIAFPSTVELVKFTYDCQSLSSGNSTMQGYVKLYLGETLVATPHSFTTANQGGFVWKESDTFPATLDDTTNAGTEFDRVEWFFQKNVSGGADEFVDVYFQVCFNPVE